MQYKFAYKECIQPWNVIFRGIKQIWSLIFSMPQFFSSLFMFLSHDCHSFPLRIFKLSTLFSKNRFLHSKFSGFQLRLFNFDLLSKTVFYLFHCFVLFLDVFIYLLHVFCFLQRTPHCTYFSGASHFLYLLIKITYNFFAVTFYSPV